MVMSWVMRLSYVAFLVFLITCFVAIIKHEKEWKRERAFRNALYERIERNREYLKRYYEDCIMIVEDYYQVSDNNRSADKYDYIAFVKENEKWKIAYQITTFYLGYRPDGGDCAIEIPENLVNKSDPKILAAFITEKTGLKYDLSDNEKVISFCNSYLQSNEPIDSMA